MIYIEDFYKTFLEAVRSDYRGLTVSPDEFNRMINVVNQELYDDYIDKFEQDTKNIDELAYWKIHNYAISLSLSGSVRVGNLPSNYYYLIGKPRIVDGDYTRRVDLLTTYEDAVREDDYLTKATLTHPTATIGGIDTSTSAVQIRVRPSTVTTVYVDYLREITVPFLDYYTNDETYNITYLADTDVAQTVPAGSTYRDGTAGAASVTSLTSDLLWDVADIPALLAKMLKKVGVQLADESLYQAGTAEEIKNESK